MFLFRLALALGCTVGELEQRLTAKEFGEWLAYWQLEPWGAWRDNWHHAHTASLIFNSNKGKAQQAMKVRDFMYEDKGVSIERLAKTFSAKMKAMAQGSNNGKPR